MRVIYLDDVKEYIQRKFLDRSDPVYTEKVNISPVGKVITFFRIANIRNVHFQELDKVQSLE